MARYTINLNRSSTQFLFTTVRLEGVCRDGSTSVGTAFFFNAAGPTEKPRVFLITNNHVLKDCESVRLRVHIASNMQESSKFCVDTEELLTIKAPSEVWVPHPDASIDLCGAPLSSLLEKAGPVPNLYYTTMASANVPSAEEQSQFPHSTELRGGACQLLIESRPR